MTVPPARIALAALAFSAGCAHDALDKSFGLIYRAQFAAQVAPHPGRELLPMRGEEGRRVMQNMLHTLGGDEKAASSGGGGGAMPSMPAMGGQQPQANPFAMKAR